MAGQAISRQLLDSARTSAKMKSLLSRKTLITLAFIAAFIFLYRIGDHPRIVNTMQPTAYYDQYDEPVCLPEQHIAKHPPPEKAKAAFVVLIRNRLVVRLENCGNALG